jgi:hypothetical protein
VVMADGVFVVTKIHYVGDVNFWTTSEGKSIKWGNISIYAGL